MGTVDWGAGELEEGVRNVALRFGTRSFGEESGKGGDAAFTWGGVLGEGVRGDREFRPMASAYLIICLLVAFEGAERPAVGLYQ